ncbi:GNAT family N-acetyltransferase [Staphylococcus sp. ACRSN]|uniref:GNAT family N-acetyltransferase n=1 Tax=Staphylococcus sp. ACRSN TaxID=2918214 RepID=UPI001EF3BABF|nr:GNAT family N-acetyltransferase [Staphylococcus sp. ACRSN]MCG7339491.1 GNAT family N-acetyltransferase [Staphylococcus sp. ACRSN]
MEFKIEKTKNLSNIELIDIMRERIKVFVVEQNCPYQEVDTEDNDALHVLIKEDKSIVAYTRIIEKEDYISFGRVLVTETNRNKNYGRKIVQKTIEVIKNQYNTRLIRISGQSHLQAFYESFGFECVSEVYLEDNIPHVTLDLNL